MKIAVNTRLLQKNKMDGIGVFTHEIFSRLVKKLPDATFYFLFDHQPDTAFIYSANVKPVVLFPPTKTPMLYKLWFQVQVPRVLKKINPDIFISPDGNIPLKTTVQTLNVIHDLNFEHFPQYLPAKWLRYYQENFPVFARESSKIITVSQYSKNDIAHTYGIDKEKIEVVNNAAADFFNPLSDEQKQLVQNHYTGGKPYFIFVGSLHPRKNISTLLNAFEKLKSEHSLPHQLVLAGKKMWWTDQMEQTRQKMKYKNEVVFTGRLTNDELNRLLASAEALTYIPVFEGFGIPVLEAFKCSVPVICSNTTSLPEVAGDAAVLVHPDDVSQIANAMNLVATNKAFRQSLITKGNKRLQLFSWDKSAEKFEKIILAR